jgi:hypothetical protein
MSNIFREPGAVFDPAQAFVTAAMVTVHKAYDVHQVP